MDTQGQKNADWGFQAPADGWYLMEFMGDIKESIKEINGEKRTSLQVPLKGVESYPDGEAVAFQMSIFVPLSGETDKEIGFAKKKMADVLVNSGLYEAFEKRYPGGDISILDQRIIDGIKIKLPEKQVMVKIETKENKKVGKTFTNIVALATRDFKPDKDERKTAKKEKPVAKESANGTESTEGW
jgi:hypothetical protein